VDEPPRGSSASSPRGMVAVGGTKARRGHPTVVVSFPLVPPADTILPPHSPSAEARASGGPKARWPGRRARPLPHLMRSWSPEEGEGICFFHRMRGRARCITWAQRVHGVGRCAVGEKRINFLTETLSKLRFYGSSTLSTPQLPHKWVRREGYGGSNLCEKGFSNYSIFIV
jgi:hypothetical protein